MNIDLEPYQLLAVESFRDFLAHELTSQRLREIGDKGGFDAALWRRFAEMGGANLSLPEEQGGGGGTLLDAVLIGEECGRRVAPLPYAEAVVATRSLGADDGTLGVFAEAAEATWHPDGTLTARLDWVRGGEVAQYLVLLMAGRLAVVDLDASGVVRTALPNLGALSLARVQLDRVAVRLVVDVTPAQAQRCAAELWLLRAAELVGAGRQALTLTTDHVVTRHQFGRAIGSFQAIQHRMADCLTALDAAELLLWRAGSYADEPELLRYYSAVALLQAIRASEQSTRDGLQFFGGYGFTLEYDIHLYLRFAKSLGVLARSPEARSAALRNPLGTRSVEGM